MATSPSFAMTTASRELSNPSPIQSGTVSHGSLLSRPRMASMCLKYASAPSGQLCNQPVLLFSTLNEVLTSVKKHTFLHVRVIQR